MTEQDYLNSLSGEPVETITPQVNDGTDDNMLTWNDLTDMEQWILKAVAKGERVYFALPTRRLEDNGLIVFVDFFGEFLVQFTITTTGQQIIPKSVTPQVDDDTFLILGVNAETWNALPPGARYYLRANEARRMLEQDWEAMQGEGL